MKAGKVTRRDVRPRVLQQVRIVEDGLPRALDLGWGKAVEDGIALLGQLAGCPRDLALVHACSVPPAERRDSRRAKLSSSGILKENPLKSPHHSLRAPLFPLGRCAGP